MSLADYKPRKREIRFDGGSFEIRAFSLTDVAIVIDSHQWAIEQIYVKLRARADQKLDLDEATATELLMELVRESPTLAGNIIALAADEPGPEIMRIAATLPMTVQIEALTAIGQLTFTDMAAVKKFGADVMTLIGGILPTPTETPAETQRAA